MTKTSYLDQKCFGIILEDANSRIIPAIYDTR